MLHEIAHALQSSPAQEDHGWHFAARLLRLWELFLGKEAAACLKAAYKDCGVRYKAPQKRKPLTEEQKQVLCDRLAMARSLRAVQKQEQTS